MALSMTKAPPWWRLPVLMALLGWLFLTVTYYLFIPIFHTIWLFTWLVIGFGWLWAGLWTFAAVPLPARQQGTMAMPLERRADRAARALIALVRKGLHASGG
ncbi:hypothetical protein ABZ297_04495 [Nonomuraea sp. NPDC005983]|uniref:hypothetical protein n=1 Tax=Nonomuraea sp. NPDC005983 TaxID=3155595 RepID=UPI0033BA8894